MPKRLPQARPDTQTVRVTEASRLFRALAAPVRLQIIGALSSGECQAGELLTSILTTKSNLSKHLRELREAGLIEGRRSGASIYYRLTRSRSAQDCRRLHLQFVTRRSDEQRAASARS